MSEERPLSGDDVGGFGTEEAMSSILGKDASALHGEESAMSTHACTHVLSTTAKAWTTTWRQQNAPEVQRSGDSEDLLEARRAEFVDTSHDDNHTNTPVQAPCKGIAMLIHRPLAETQRV